MNLGDDEFYWMCQAMRKYGGSFVQSLGTCFMKADMQNFQRLINAFPEYVATYKKLGIQAKKEWESENNG